MNSRPTRDRGKRPGSLSTCRATILGLGGIGRQLALQLAALGVTRLQLVDPRTVGRRTHAVEGYAYEDIGHPKIFAAAHLCHQLNPQLEILAQHQRSIRDLDLGDTVFCCPGTSRVWLRLGQMIGDQDTFLARCRVIGPIVHVDVACDASSWAAMRARTQSKTPSRSGRPAHVPPYAAAIAAGLAVAEFVKYGAGQRPACSIRLDLQDLKLRAKKSA